MTAIFTTEFRVRYHETDQMGVVHHSNYLPWFEVARTEWLRETGLSYRALEEDGILMPVTEATVKYKVSAKYEDLVRVAVWIELYNKVRLQFGYEVTRADDGVVLATGMTEHTFINRSGQVVRLQKTHPAYFDAMMAVARNTR